jgi:hypothetical protein
MLHFIRVIRTFCVLVSSKNINVILCKMQNNMAEARNVQLVLDLTAISGDLLETDF